MAGSDDGGGLSGVCGAVGVRAAVGKEGGSLSGGLGETVRNEGRH